jgi:uncharacterized OB-fold protein
MTVFESELKKGRFVVGECPKCHKLCWPPNDFCSNCFEELSWRDANRHGILVEYSKKDDKMFGIIEFEKTIRIMGVISNGNLLKPGQNVTILSCGYDGSPKFVFVAE